MTTPAHTAHTAHSPGPTLEVNAWFRAIAGLFVLATVALGWWVHPGWFLVTAFVGANLFQSAFTGWCPMMTILRKLGIRG
jgi:hypothetical protein